MANEIHLLLTADGDYASSAASFTQEVWQVGLRFWVGIGGSVPDSVGPLSTDLSVEAKSISRTETEWTISGNWWLAGPGGAQHLSPDDYLNDQIAPAFKAWLAATSCFSTRVRLRNLRLYPIGSTGKVVPAPPYAIGSPCLLNFTTIPTGGDSGAMVPPQLSTVASHLTNQTGRKGRGRMYLPPTNVSAIAEGALNSTNKAALQAAQVALLEALALTGTASTRPSIIGAPWTSYAYINAVRMDTIYDTQRRRRSAAAGTVSTSTVTY